MALHGSGGAYYRSSSVLSPGMAAAWSRHLWVRSSVAAGTSSYKMPAAMVGSGQNPHDVFIWSHPSSTQYKSNIHRQANNTYFTPQYVSALPADTWLAIGVTFDGTSLRQYLSGSLEVTTAVGAALNGSMDIQLLGLMSYLASSLDGSNPNNNFSNGEVAEYAYWNTALTADEMAALAKGFRANRIRPQNLVFYAPCVRGLQDVRGGRTLVKQAGTVVVSDHPRVF